MTCDRVVVGIALLIAGVAFVAGRRDEARIRELRTSADSLAEAIARQQAVSRQQRTWDSLRMTEQQAVITTLRGRLTTFQGRTDTLLDTLTTVDSASLRELRVAIGAERQAARAIIAAQDSTIQWMGSRIAYWRDTVVSARDQQLAVSQRLLREALGAKRPRTQCGLAVVAGYGTGGVGVTAGYGCTVRL